jgi:hypothetical protein
VASICLASAAPGGAAAHGGSGWRLAIEPGVAIDVDETETGPGRAPAAQPELDALYSWTRAGYDRVGDRANFETAASASDARLAEIVLGWLRGGQASRKE